MRILSLTILLALCTTFAYADESKTDTRPSIAPDIREDESKLKQQKGNFVVVPIPISNPTIGTGLVAGAAYFYKQTEEQAKVQPASVTGAGGLYTDNDSKAIVIGHQGYWSKNRWRDTSAIGAADLRLSLLSSDQKLSGRSVDWRINGQFLFAKFSRKLAGHWYGGLNLRVVDADQTFEISQPSLGFDLGSHVRSAGMGASVEYDARDMPMNTYSGRYFKADALFNDESLGSDQTYQSYSLVSVSYTHLRAHET